MNDIKYLLTSGKDISGNFVDIGFNGDGRIVVNTRKTVRRKRKDDLDIHDKCDAKVFKKADTSDNFKIGGVFTAKCYGSDGSFKWEDKFENIFVSEGLDYILGVLAKNATQEDPLYIGLYTNSGGPQDAWTLIVGMTEFSTYTGNRKEYVDGAISGSYTISNSTSPAVFAITGSATVYGAFMCTLDTGTTGGYLLCAGDFASPKALANGDTMQVSYTVGAIDDGI